MSWIKNKMYIHNAACLSIESSGKTNDVECKCLLCGEVNSYKKSDLTQGKLLICKSCKQSIELGEKIPKSDLIAIAYRRPDCVDITKDSNRDADLNSFYNYRSSPQELKLVCQCTKNSSHISVYNLLHVNQGIRAGISIPCDICDKEKQEVKNEKARKRIEEHNKEADIPLQHGVNPYVSESRRLGAISNKEQSNNEEPLRNNQPVAGSYKIGDLLGKWMITGIVENYVETNVNKFGKVSGKIEKFVALSCIDCGFTRNIRLKTFLDNVQEIKETECSICKKTKKANNKDINILNNLDYIGTIKNEFIIDDVSKDGIVKAHCLVCERYNKGKPKKYIKMPLYEWEFTSTFRCTNCFNQKINVVCPVCGQPHFSITRDRLYNFSYTNTIIGKCKALDKDGKAVSCKELAMYHNELQEMQVAKSIYNDKFTPDKIRESKGGAKLMLFNDSYIGTDEQIYQSCLCLKHNKLLSLTYNEIDNYKHEFCSNPLMTAYSNSKKGIFNRKLE